MAKKKSVPTKKFRLKWYLPILILVILVLFFALKTSFYKNSSDHSNENPPATPTISTNNWLLYEDTLNGFSLKYPDSWYYEVINIEGEAYEGGYMQGDISVIFYKKGVTPFQTFRMAQGNEQLILRTIPYESIKKLEKSKEIPITTLAGKPAIRLSTGAYVELSPDLTLFIYSPTYPLPEMDEILKSLVIEGS